MKLAEDIRSGSRSALARGITLIESINERHQREAEQLIEQLLPDTGNAYRVAITGSPGAGKSSLIDKFGMYLIGQGHQVAVLAIDPSSLVSGGSILGDKVRMNELATSDSAFIRPSPNAKTLGGIGRRTYDAMLLCEAAGFDVVLVETVGVGQSEVLASFLVDFFMVLIQPGSGDEVQGIKRGIMEMADGLCVTKCDGKQKILAEASARDLEMALTALKAKNDCWKPQVVSTSAVSGLGLERLWSLITSHRKAYEQADQFVKLRQEHQWSWMWHLVEESLIERFRSREDVAVLIDELRNDLKQNKTTPARAARSLLNL